MFLGLKMTLRSRLNLRVICFAFVAVVGTFVLIVRKNVLCLTVTIAVYHCDRINPSDLFFQVDVSRDHAVAENSRRLKNTSVKVPVHVPKPNSRTLTSQTVVS